MSLRGAQRRGNPFSLQYSIAESSTSGEYAAVYKFAQKRIYRCLSLQGRGLPQVCALVRNDMQKTGTRQRVQGGGTRGKVRRRWQFCLVQRPCLCGHAACFCMSLRGAKRRGNPHPRRNTWQVSSTWGKPAEAANSPKSAFIVAFPCGDADCHTSSPQSPPCPAPAKGRSRATLPWVSFPHKACRFAGSRGYAVRRPAGEQRSLGAPLPAKGHPLRGPHALVRNDMPKTDTRQRM